MTRKITTEGIVLGKRGLGEATTLVQLHTRELGLIYASAKSARREQSKLRYGLEPFTCGRFSLVAGRHEWKVAGVDAISYPLMSASLSARIVAGRVCRLLVRLIQGEEVSQQLYEHVSHGFALLSSVSDSQGCESIECVLVLRILFSLGYLPKTAELAPFIADEDLSLELAARAAQRRSTLIRAINDSLSVSGL
ncbi:MAG: DNA repair protein RecO [Patescibacteria group bacterium]|nr:DNA repair protein RecO [Patescibacteria group bacterium]